MSLDSIIYKLTCKSNIVKSKMVNWADTWYWNAVEMKQKTDLLQITLRNSFHKSILIFNYLHLHFITYVLDLKSARDQFNHIYVNVIKKPLTPQIFYVIVNF